MSETPEGIDNVSGKLDSQQLDAIRLETQHIPPAQREREKTHIGKANRTIIEQYGKYINDQQTDDEISDRYLFMDFNTRIHFLHEWAPEETSYEDLRDLALVAATTDLGHFVIGDTDYWSNLDETNKRAVKKRFNEKLNITSDDEIAKIFNENFKEQAYIHETTHLYQDDTLPVAFLESGAYYYEKELQEKSPYSSALSVKRKERIASFYTGLINNYGEDVHKLFFGSLENNEVKEAILNEFTDDVVNELFPNIISD